MLDRDETSADIQCNNDNSHTKNSGRGAIGFALSAMKFLVFSRKNSESFRDQQNCK